MMQDFGLPVAMAVIDTAGKAAGLRKTGELNDDAAAKVIMSALAEASIQTGVLFVGVAHFGKNVETGTKGQLGSRMMPTSSSRCSESAASTASSTPQPSARASAAAALMARSSRSKPRKQKAAAKRR
jgi:hypothetical protein